jgi:hypothetical protein
MRTVQPKRIKKVRSIEKYTVWKRIDTVENATIMEGEEKREQTGA